MNLEQLFFNYSDVRREMVDGIKNLTHEQLHWKPDGYQNSIASLLVHIAEAEYWWIYCVAQDHQDEHEEDFGQDKQTLPEILALLEEWHEKTTSFMRTFTVDQFEKVSYYLHWRKADVTLGWLLWHVVEHQARHRGQIFMMMRMQGLDVPRV